MNLADAIRQAAQQPTPRAETQVFTSGVDTIAVPVTEVAVDAVTSQPVHIPEPPQVSTGNVVRLELFLNPEQLSNLFRAISATQHSMMTLRETASYLRVNPGVLEQMAQDGEIPAFNIDGRWRFPKHGVDEWLTVQAFRRESA